MWGRARESNVGRPFASTSITFNIADDTASSRSGRPPRWSTRLKTTASLRKPRHDTKGAARQDSANEDSSATT
eukprot:6512427-Pyramimonas_sp.AAC.1